MEVVTRFKIIRGKEIQKRNYVYQCFPSIYFPLFIITILITHPLRNTYN